MTDITELTSVQKNANIHRLSMLIAYAPNDELRQMAVEVEHYTDQLIEALEKAQSRDVIQSAKDYHFDQQADRIDELNAELEREREKSRRVMSRIAELESRTVTVKLPQRLQPGADGWDDWYVHSDDEGEYLKFDDVLAMLTAAGIKVEAE